ncbi:hypothetical protein V7968_03560 [Nocardia vulneris]|uniref:hypothetical protein n=1 Tax=Nocardia vulneris TaxID=1141657 RepID=UPI0030D37707
MMNGLMLSAATVQEIQLELIRRSRFNDFDGAAITASLEKHRSLWVAAYLDRIGVSSAGHPDWVPALSLIKLRDLPNNTWNTDTLVVLTENLGKARELAAVAEADRWLAHEVIVQDNAEEMGAALGSWPYRTGVLMAWWD